MFSAWAQVTVQTNLNPRAVEVGDQFTISYEVRSSDGVASERPEPPEINGARLIQESTSQRLNSMAVTNDEGELEFKTVQTQIYHFIYQATKDGDLKVPSVTISAGGKELKASGLTVKSFPSGAGGGQVQRPSQRQGNDPFDDPFNDPFFDSFRKQAEDAQEKFNQLLQRQFGQGGTPGFQSIPPGSEDDAFFIAVEVDKTEAYEGEQIRATWYLYTKSGVREIDTLKYPDLKGFWKEDIELATLLNFSRDTLNGSVYNKALLASYALFPLEAGKATIDAYKAKVGIISGFGRMIKDTKSSKPVPILVKPLPEEGKPDNFSSAVGQYQITASLDPDSTYVTHQPFILNLRIEGMGNAKQFELPELNLPDSVEVYDIKKDSKFFKTGKSYKYFEIYLIPREPGKLVIPAITTNYFDPNEKAYKTISTTELETNILKGAGQQGLQASRISTRDKKEPLTMLTQWEPKQANPQPMLILWIGAFLMTGVGSLAYAAIGLGWFVKSAGLREKVALRFKKIHHLHNKKQWRQVGIEVTNLVYFVLGEVSGQGGADVEFDKLMAKCPPSIRREVGSELKKVLDKFYLLGFGPDSAIQSQVQNDGVKEPMKKVEKLLQKVIDMTEVQAP